MVDLDVTQPITMPSGHQRLYDHVSGQHTDAPVGQVERPRDTAVVPGTLQGQAHEEQGHSPPVHHVRDGFAVGVLW